MKKILLLSMLAFSVYGASEANAMSELFKLAKKKPEELKALKEKQLKECQSTSAMWKSELEEELAETKKLPPIEVISERIKNDVTKAENERKERIKLKKLAQLIINNNDN